MLAGLCLLEGSLSPEGPSKQNEVQWKGPRQRHGSQRCDGAGDVAPLGLFPRRQDRLTVLGRDDVRGALDAEARSRPLYMRSFVRTAEEVRDAGP